MLRRAECATRRGDSPRYRFKIHPGPRGRPRRLVRRVAHPSELFVCAIHTEGAPSFRVLCERVGSTDLNPERRVAHPLDRRSYHNRGCPVLAFFARAGFTNAERKEFEETNLRRRRLPHPLNTEATTTVGGRVAHPSELFVCAIHPVGAPSLRPLQGREPQLPKARSLKKPTYAGWPEPYPTVSARHTTGNETFPQNLA